MWRMMFNWHLSGASPCGLDIVTTDVRGDQCHLWRNSVVIDEQSSSPFHITDGDYIKVFVGDMDQQDTCLSDLGSSRSDDTNSPLGFVDFEDHGLFQQSLHQLNQACASFIQSSSTSRSISTASSQLPW